MNVTVLFPPSICLPNQVYYALPLFAAVLRRAGHRVRTVDLNLVAADLLLDERMARSLHDEATREIAGRSTRVRCLPIRLFEG